MEIKLNNLFKKATKFHNQKQYKKALEIWHKLPEEIFEKLESRTKGDIFYNMGGAYFQLGDYKKSSKYYDLALKYGCDDARASKSINAFRMGDLKTAFKWYHHRWVNNKFVKVGFLPGVLRATRPQHIKNKIVFVADEQGYGDNIIASLGFRWLSENTEEAWIYIRKPLKRLFDNLYNFPNLHFITDEKSILNLPDYKHYFDVQMGNMDCFSFTYLDQGIEPQTNINFGENSSGNKIPRVAIVPFSLPGSENFFKKNIDPKIFRKFKDQADLFLAQIIMEEHPPLPGFLRDVESIPQGEDFWYTAQKLKKCDAIFTIDTSVAHLAGLLNLNNVYLIINKEFDWRWKYVKLYPKVKIIQLKEVQKTLEDFLTNYKKEQDVQENDEN